MDLLVSDDQRALAEGIASLVAGRMPLEALRALEGAPDTVDPDHWRALADAGVFALMVDEADGGVGLGLADAAVVFEELGKALVPGPLVGTTLAAGLVEGAAEGTAVVGLLEAGAPDPEGRADPVPLLVEHPRALDALVVLPPATAAAGSGVAVRVAMADVARRDLDHPLDPLTPLALVEGALPAGDVLGGPAETATLRVRGAVLTAALQVGAAARCVELAVAYAKARHQFGRAIGSFQAVKHLCADMLVRAEVARAALHAAAVLADQPDVAAAEAESGPLDADGVLWRAVAAAKLLGDEAALANARTCIQVHGGMGFTWEVPVHLYLKRARVRAQHFGTAAVHAESAAELL